MGHLKIKDIEGDAPDVSELFQKNGCSLAEYLGTEPRKKLSVLWIWAMAMVFFILASCLWIDVFNLTWTKVSVLGVFTLGFLITIVTHYNYKNWPLTVITGLAGLAIVLMALNVYTPQEIARKIEDKISIKK
jgi:hypothetical protein